MPKHDRTGRTKVVEQYAKLPYAMLKSDAWRSLNGSAIKVLLELHTRFHGANNGEMFISLKEAANNLKMGKATVHAAFAELEAKGFIVTNSKGTFTKGDASTFRLTFKPVKGKMGPTDEWKDWRAPERPRRVRKPHAKWKNVAIEKARASA
jgi:DNA-binding transcriptional MocR family regulator